MSTNTMILELAPSWLGIEDWGGPFVGMGKRRDE
jgi:hypothetical protein